jgi:hypothetical protein
MSFLPERTVLGQLEIIEVYDFYDQPALFSCKNKSGQIFIVVWVDSSEVADLWLYASVSSSRFQDARRGLIELRDIFTNSEDSFVYQVETPYQDDLNASARVIYCHEITNDYLPEPRQIIQPENDCDDSNIEQVSREKRREVVDFILQFPDAEITDAPIGELGSLLFYLQETIYAIGQIKSGKLESHIIQQEVTQKTQVVISGIFKGSFGMRLEGTVYDEDSLGLGESLLGQCMSEFIQLINLGANADELRGKLYTLKKKTAFKYSEFLNALTRIEISKLHIDWASPNSTLKKTGEIGLETVFKTLEVIKNTKLRVETEIYVNVNLIQINYNSKTITLQEVGSRKKYKCFISESASKDVETVSKKVAYIATIQDYVILSPVVDKEKHEYELLSLKLKTNSTITRIDL